MILGFLPSIIWETDEPFGQLVKRHIFGPLDMNSTTYSYARASGDHLAEGFTRLVNLRQVPDPAWLALTIGDVKTWKYWDAEGSEGGDIISGAGGVISNAQDMARTDVCVVLAPIGLPLRLGHLGEDTPAPGGSSLHGRASPSS